MAVSQLVTQNRANTGKAVSKVAVHSRTLLNFGKTETEPHQQGDRGSQGRRSGREPVSTLPLLHPRPRPPRSAQPGSLTRHLPGHAARPGSGARAALAARCAPAHLLPGAAPNAAARAGRRGCSPGAPSAQGAAGRSAGGQSRRRGRELIPGTRRPECAASGLPCASPQPPHPGSRRAGRLIFPLARPESQ